LHVYVDEAGDLGFGANSTKFFIVAYVKCESPLTTEIKMKRALKELHQNKKYHYSQNELKFACMNKKCREYVLQKINNCDLSINVVVVEKAKIYPELRNNAPRLYNYFVVHYIMLSLLPQLATNRQLNMILDKSMSSWKIKDFNTYAKDKVRFFIKEKNTKQTLDNFFKYKNAKSTADNLSLAHVNSQLEPCLQVADAIAGAYFQKYENNNRTYVDIIADKVSGFRYLWK